jgi:hypothetical protein
LHETNGTTFFEGKFSTPDPKQLLRILELIRARLGDHVMLRIDSNQAYSLATARRLARLLEELGVGNWEKRVPTLSKLIELRRHRSILFSTDNTDIGGAMDHKIRDAICGNPAVLGGIGRLCASSVPANIPASISGARAVAASPAPPMGDLSCGGSSTLRIEGNRLHRLLQLVHSRIEVALQFLVFRAEGLAEAERQVAAGEPFQALRHGGHNKTCSRAASARSASTHVRSAVATALLSAASCSSRTFSVAASLKACTARAMRPMSSRRFRPGICV